MKPIEMACIGFDLDETLGRFSVPFYHLLFLQPHTSLYREAWSGLYGTEKIAEPIPLSESLQSKLDHAFDLFVDCIAQENQETLGLLRPGIFEIARRLYELKLTTPPKVRAVVIYSNNGNMATLRLAAALIEKVANTPGLFCNFVHRFHPSRASEVTVGDPGNATKTLQTLVNAFEEGGCPRDEIRVENIYFFDDRRHDDIADVIGPRYFLVPPYKFDADPVVFNRCFVKAFQSAGLLQDKEYWSYISPMKTTTIKDIWQYLQSSQITTFRKQRVNNTAVLTKFNKVFPPLPPVSQNEFRTALKTMRRLEQMQNKGVSLNANQATTLAKAKSTLTQFEAQNPNRSGGSHSKKTRRRRRGPKN